MATIAATDAVYNQVLDGQRRYRLTRREMVPCEENLGGLAGEQSEWCHVSTASPADALSAWPKLRLAPGGMHIRQQAARTANRSARERKDRREAPADPLNALEDVGDALLRTT